MQLNRFTDLGIRVLMYLGSIEGPSVTIARLAEDLQVSKNHLVKVVHFMAQQQCGKANKWKPPVAIDTE